MARFCASGWTEPLLLDINCERNLYCKVNSHTNIGGAIDVYGHKGETHSIQ